MKLVASMDGNDLFSLNTQSYNNYPQLYSQANSDHILTMPGTPNLVCMQNQAEISPSQNNFLSTLNDHTLTNIDDFCQNLAVSLRHQDTEFTAKILDSLTNDEELCFLLIRSQHCIALILDLLFEGADFSDWPYKLCSAIRQKAENTLTKIHLSWAKNGASSNMRMSDLCMCLNMIFKFRRDLAILMQVSDKCMTVHIETIVVECVDRIMSNINELERILDKHRESDKAYIFYGGVIHLIFEGLYTMAGCLTYHKNSKDSCLGPCPYFLLKIAEKLTHLLFKTLSKIRDQEIEFLFHYNDQYKTVLFVLTFFTSTTLISCFSCNCMGRAYAGRHISNDTEIGHIILGSSKALIDLCKLFKRNANADYFMNSKQFNKSLDVLIDTLLNSTMAMIKSAEKMIATVLSAVHELLLYLLSFHRANELSPHFVDLQNYEFVSFLCRSSTFQSPSDENPNTTPSFVRLNQYSVVIQQKSLLILSLLCPLFKSDPRFIVSLVETRLPSRLVLSIQLSTDPTFIDILCEAVIKLCSLGLGGVFCKNNLVSHLEQLESKLGLNYTLVKANVAAAMSELNVDSSIYTEEWLKGVSGQTQTDPEVSSEPCTGRTHVPWLNCATTTQKFANIGGVPPEQSQNGPLSLRTKRHATFCVKSDPDCSIVRNRSLQADLSSDFSSDNNDTFLRKPLPSNRKTKPNKNLSLNVPRDASRMSKSKLDKSIFKKLLGKSFQNGHETENSRGLWSYMSNMFRSKHKSGQN